MDEICTTASVSLRPGVSLGELSEHQFVIASSERTLKVTIKSEAMNLLFRDLIDGTESLISDTLESRDRHQLQWLMAEGFIVSSRESQTEKPYSIDYLENYFPVHESTNIKYNLVVDGENQIAERLRELLPCARLAGRETLNIFTSHVEDIDEMLAANRRYIKNQEKSIFVSTLGPRIRIGPFVIPHETACYACFVKRSELATVNQKLVDVAHRARTTISYRFPASPVISTMAAAFSAAAILRAITNASGSFWCGMIIQASAIDMSAYTSMILKVPRCTACGKTNLDRMNYVPSQVKLDV